jgi:hypothetical protein
VQWEDLGQDVRQSIQEHTGPVLKAEMVSEGINAEIALIVHTADRAVFVKGVAAEDARRCLALRREAAIAPHVRDIAPEVLWSAHPPGWSLAGFEYIHGRRADLTPGSVDLPKMAEALTRLGETSCPDLAVQLPTLQTRCANHTPASELWRFAGTRLLHTDLNPGNVLVTDDRAYLVDWACPTKGPAWIDPANWTLILITCGHTPDQAETWAARVPSWHTADPTALDVYVRSQVRVWAEEITKPYATQWTRDTEAAIRRWAEHRAL